MASSRPYRKSRLAVRFTGCLNPTNLSLLSIYKICFDVPWQFLASLKLHPPPSLTPALNVYQQTNSPALPHTSLSCIKDPAALYEVSSLTISSQFLSYTSGDNWFILTYLTQAEPKKGRLSMSNLPLAGQSLHPLVRLLTATRHCLQPSQLSPIWCFHSP